MRSACQSTKQRDKGGMDRFDIIFMDFRICLFLYSNMVGWFLIFHGSRGDQLRFHLNLIISAIYWLFFN